MAPDTQYSIGDVAGLAGTTPRTIRYYVAQGLLPAPIGAGGGAHYTDAHMARLRLIRRLQRQHLPLSEIRQRLATLGDHEVAALVADDEPAAAPADSALDYLRAVLGSTTALPPATASATAPGTHGTPAMARLLVAAPVMPRVAQDASPPSPPPAESGPVETESPDAHQRSQWDRIGLTPNIEIHVRRPLGRLENKRVERLITIARQLLKEDQP